MIDYLIDHMRSLTIALWKVAGVFVRFLLNMLAKS